MADRWRSRSPTSAGLHPERGAASVVETLVRGIVQIAGAWLRRVAPAVALGLAVAARAADPSVTLDIQPRAMKVGEVAVATITVSNLSDAPPPQMPDLDGFQVQSAGQESRLNIVNGAVDRSVVHRFALTAVKAGDHVVGPFRFEAGGKAFDLAAVKVQVVPADAGAPGAGTVDDLSKLAFARVRVDKPEAYVHERFTITVLVYSRGIELDRQVELMNMPQSGIKLGPFAEVNAGHETIDGQVYQVRAFRAEGRALTAGEIVLAPTLRAGVVVRRQGRSRGPFGDSFFEDFFAGSPFGRGERRPVDLASEPVKLSILPLPVEGRPDSFSGAVGACEWDVAVRPTEISAGEPVTVTMTVRGEANLEAVNAPRLDLGAAFRVYDPRLVSRGDNPREKIFEQVVIPRDATATEIPPLSFSYFDTAARAYRTLTRGPFPLVVHASTNGAASLRLAMATPSGPQILEGAPDIVYLKPATAVPAITASRLRALRRFDAFRWPGAMIHALPGVAALAALLLARRREALEHDVARARREQAPRAARPAVARARAAVTKGDAPAFHEAMWEALTTYFGNRLNLAPGEVARDRVVAAFAAAGVERETLDGIARLFDACDEARYAGSDARAGGMRDRVEVLLRILSRCERAKL
ncbi:MAG: protein BatD [Lentisphaerae bacterium]|nr:protein BatD [Lentisphaerota bacterium]